jgi:hypothetical protein
MMVVETREQRAACGVEHPLARKWLEPVGDSGDHLALAAEIERSAAADLGAPNQQ